MRGLDDAERIRGYVESRLHLIPRYRQRLAYVPLERHPVWVDDPRFNIFYHVRHTALPNPGEERQLKRLCGRIFSQKLDYTKPLWEVWIVEGLREGRFALIAKAHHCMVDYCWAKWNIELGNDNTNDAGWAGTSWNHFVDQNGDPVNVTAGLTTIMPLLSYQYESSAVGICLPRGRASR